MFKKAFNALLTLLIVGSQSVSFLTLSVHAGPFTCESLNPTDQVTCELNSCSRDSGSSSCVTPEVYGCTNPSADNYNSSATIDDGSCTIGGCMDPSADNYNIDATYDNGSCVIGGCMDPSADNYNGSATYDDGSCVIGGCMNPSADNYNIDATYDDGSCMIGGCMNPSAENYDGSATYDNGSCIMGGCMDPGADNYNIDATYDDGSCVYPMPAVIINEVQTAGTNDWIELGSTQYEQNIDGWYLLVSASGGNMSMSLNGTIPAYGLLTFELSEMLADSGAIVELYDSAANKISAISYGEMTGENIPWVTEPASYEYIIADGESIELTDEGTKGWINGAMDYTADCSQIYTLEPGVDPAPTLYTLDYCLSDAMGVNTNIGEILDASRTPDTEGDELYFEIVGLGKLVFTESLNLTDQNTRTLLQFMGDQLEGDIGLIGMDTSICLEEDEMGECISETSSDVLEQAGAELYMYNVNDIGIYGDVLAEDIIALDSDTLEELEGEAMPILTDAIYIAETEWSPEMLLFTTDHFTTFQIDELTGSFSISNNEGYITGTTVTMTLESSEAEAEYAITITEGEIPTYINGTTDIDGNATEEITFVAGDGVKNIDVQFFKGNKQSDLYEGDYTVDTTAPEVTSMFGDGTTDYIVEFDGVLRPRITFNEELSEESENDIIDILWNAIDYTYIETDTSDMFYWAGNQLEVGYLYEDYTGGFANDVYANITDAAGNTAFVQLVDSAEEANQVVASGSTVELSGTTNEVIIPTNNNSITVDVDGTVTDGILNVANFIDEEYDDATLPEITINADTSIGDVSIEIPDQTYVQADEDWNGIINMPTVKENSSVTVTADSGKTATVSSVIEIGFDDVELTFDKAVKITLAGQAGKYIGYTRDGVFTKITDVCTTNSQVWADANLAAGGDCKVDEGGDLVVWTKHFTKFATYTQANKSTGGGGGISTVFQKDLCEIRDCSSSYYDSICGICTVDETHEAAGEDLSKGSVEGSKYSEELNDAYLYAYGVGITSMSTIQDANIDGGLIRSHMAKMMVGYAVNVLKKTPDPVVDCNFTDIDQETPEMKTYIRLACYLGLMGVNTTKFNPNGEVTRADFATVFSRLLYGTTYNHAAPNYYQDHLDALKTNGILTNITPDLKELRGYVMLMLYRANQNR